MRKSSNKHYSYAVLIGITCKPRAIISLYGSIITCHNLSPRLHRARVRCARQACRKTRAADIGGFRKAVTKQYEGPLSRAPPASIRLMISRGAINIFASLATRGISARRLRLTADKA